MNSDDNYSLPPELLKLAKEVDAEIIRALDYTSGGYLVRREVPILAFDGITSKVTLNGSDIIDFLAPLLHTRTHDAVGAAPPPQKLSFTNRAGRKILEIIETYFYELREIVCKNNKTKFPLSTRTVVAVAGLTHWCMQHFGITEEWAKSVATAILVALLAATKGTFCKMTVKEAKAAIALA
jgi:hypothetical protein